MTTKKRNRVRDLLPELTVATALESIRENLDITKVAMAEKLEISKSAYGNIVNHDEAVSLERAVRFAKILGYSERNFAKYAIRDNFKRINLKYDVALFDPRKQKIEVRDVAG